MATDRMLDVMFRLSIARALLNLARRQRYSGAITAEALVWVQRTQEAVSKL